MGSNSRHPVTATQIGGYIQNSDTQVQQTSAPSPPAAPNPPDRDGKGRFAAGNMVGAHTQFAAGNWAALKHSLNSERWPPDLAVLRDEVEQFLGQMLADEGDPSAVPARRHALLNYRARLHRRILQLDAALEQRGLVDKRGKLRVAWLQQLGGLIEKARALDTTLGLGRSQKLVPSLSEYLASRQSANRHDQSDVISAIPENRG